MSISLEVERVMMHYLCSLLLLLRMNMLTDPGYSLLCAVSFQTPVVHALGVILQDANIYQDPEK